MAQPTPDDLAAFFGSLTQLRTLYSRVDMIFRGNNTTPDILAYWPGQTSPATTVQSVSDSASDLTAAMDALFTSSMEEGQLRQQLVSLMRQVAETKQQLGIA